MLALANEPMMVLSMSSWRFSMASMLTTRSLNAATSAADAASVGPWLLELLPLRARPPRPGTTICVDDGKPVAAAKGWAAPAPAPPPPPLLAPSPSELPAPTLPASTLAAPSRPAAMPRDEDGGGGDGDGDGDDDGLPGTAGSVSGVPSAAKDCRWASHAGVAPSLVMLPRRAAAVASSGIGGATGQAVGVRDGGVMDTGTAAHTYPAAAAAVAWPWARAVAWRICPSPHAAARARPSSGGSWQRYSSCPGSPGSSPPPS